MCCNPYLDPKELKEQYDNEKVYETYDLKERDENNEN
jgi:hypothetical protein